MTTTEIADGEVLYRYVSPTVLPEGQSALPTAIFNDPELSCDWKALQHSPETSPHVDQGKNLLVSISVCDEIRNPRNPKREGELIAAWQQTIIHDPLAAEEGNPFTPNSAHSLIKGKKKLAVVSAICANSTYAILRQMKSCSS